MKKLLRPKQYQPVVNTIGIITAIGDIRRYESANGAYSERYISIDYIYGEDIYKKPYVGSCVVIVTSKPTQGWDYSLMANVPNLSLLEYFEQNPLSIGGAVQIEFSVDSYVNPEKGKYIAKNVLEMLRVMEGEEKEQLIQIIKVAKQIRLKI